MASQNPNPLYPHVVQSNPEASSLRRDQDPAFSSSTKLYPSLDMADLVENLFPEAPAASPSAPPAATEEVVVRIPGAILHLIDRHYSVELACGDFAVVRLRQGESVVAVLARVGDEIQWPLARDEAAVKLDDSHYFFALRAPGDHRRSDSEGSSDEDEDRRKAKGGDDHGELLNYGLTIASKGQEALVRELDSVLACYSSFSVQKVSEKAAKGEALDGTVAAETSPGELRAGKKKEMVEERSAAYWTTLAPNVEEYSGTAAKMIAAGSGQLIRGILWCGDVTVERLKWGNEVMKKRMSPEGAEKEVSPQTMRRIRRYRKKMSLCYYYYHYVFGFLICV